MYTYEVSGHFDAAHFLPEYLGRCANMHGHRWEYRITISLPELAVLPDSGMFVDFADIKYAAEIYDHTLINDFIGTPTAEVIAVTICNAIVMFDLPTNTAISVEITESPGSTVKYVTYVYASGGVTDAKLYEGETSAEPAQEVPF